MFDIKSEGLLPSVTPALLSFIDLTIQLILPLIKFSSSFGKNFNIEGISNLKLFFNILSVGGGEKEYF